MKIVPTQQDAITADRNPANAYLAGLAEGSRRTMRAALENIAQIFNMTAVDFPWHELRAQHTNAIRAQIEALYQPSTANRHLAALRGVLKQSWRIGHITADEYMKAVDFKTIPNDGEIEGRYVTPQEYRALLATCKDDVLGIRDCAIITVLYMCGLRRDELVRLNRGSVTAEGFKFKGKRKKPRTVALNEDARAALDAWLKLLPDDGDDKPLFISLKGNRLTTQAIYHLLAHRSGLADIPPVSPHDLRHAFISNMWDSGEDGATIAAIVGHSNIEQTRRYDRRPLKARQRAVDRMGKHIRHSGEWSE